MSARLAGLVSTILIIQLVTFGLSWHSVLSAVLIFAVVYLLVFRYTRNQAHTVHQSLVLKLLPKISSLAELSRTQSQQTMLEINAKTNQLRQLYVSMVEGKALNEQEQQNYANQISETFKELLILLQFGDRLDQQQSGVIESIQMIQSALNHEDLKGWDEETLLKAIERIEQRTRTENDKSPSEEGSVTFF